MKALLINEVCGTGSTGKIAVEAARELMNEGWEARVAFGREAYVPENCRDLAVRIGSDLDVRAHALYTRLTDRHGLLSIRATRKFLQWADAYDPDLLWLHNIHGYYINYELLFRWIKSRPQMQVKWTLHDCWTFTGHCTHFSVEKCEKWHEGGCGHCPLLGEYPKSLFYDNSAANFRKKKAAFTGVQNMTLITPSEWLADLVKQSFLKEYPVEVVHNTINTQFFRPTPGDLREKYHLQGKKVILGVASQWSRNKGLDDFIRLSAMLDDRFVIVLLGLNETQIKSVPSGILALPRTRDQYELAQWYTTADVHLVLSREETFGMTIIEALACGTVPVVLEGTACEEVVRNHRGYVVKYDLEEIMETVITACEADGSKT